MDVFNEDTTKTVTVSFFADKEQTTPVTPSSDIGYGVWCHSNGRFLGSGTESASSVVNIVLSDTFTPILNAANDFELRELAIVAPTSDGPHTQRYLYKVKNLRGPLRYKWFKGDSYLNADSRAVRCTFGKGVPDLDGTVSMSIEDPNGVVDTLTVTGTIVTATGSLKDVRFDLTAAQTDTLTAGDYSVTVYVTQASGSKLTVKKGRATVTDKAM